MTGGGEPAAEPAADAPERIREVLGATYRQACAAMDRSLVAIERDSPARVREAQWQAVGRMVLHAAAHAPLYRDRLAPVLRNGRFVREGWADLPILTRAEAAEAGEAMRADTVPDGAASIRRGNSSGSTGLPLHLTFTLRTLVVSQAHREQQIRWFGLDPAAKLASIRVVSRAYPGYPAGPASAWNSRVPSAPGPTFAIEEAPGRQLDWLIDQRPRYVRTQPTNLREIAREAARRAVRVPGLEAAMTVGEPVTEDIRRDCRDALGLRLIDSYGCEEAGTLALECEVSGRYHLCVTAALVEILDEAGRPAAPGEAGRVVITSLANHATPFIRYALGDHAVQGPATPCPCGRTLPSVDRILGRSRNMIRLPNGERRWVTEAAIARFRPYVPYRQFQLVQAEDGAIAFRYVPEAGAGPADDEAVRRLAADLFHPGIRMHAVAVADLPRSPGGKFLDVVSLMA